MDWVLILVKLVGALKLYTIIYELFIYLIQHLQPRLHAIALKYPARSDLQKPWALVTGASDGIGAEYCRQLAIEGFNIVLVSRTLSKLNAVNYQLKKLAPDVKTKIIIADFSVPEATKPKYFTDILDQVESLDISIVIANAGLLHIGQVIDTAP